MKKVIVIGASDGLGKAFAQECVNKNISIVNISRTPCEIVGSIVNVKCDLSNQADVENAVKEIKTNHSDFSAIVNCAAIVAMEKINEITFEKFEKAWKVNTIGPLYFLSLLFDKIVENEADILNVGTTADLQKGFINQLAYTSTKYGLRGGTYNFNLELAKTNARVIYVHCGGMNTNMHKKDYGLEIENPSEWMKPSDVAKILLYLIELPKQIEISDITINRKNGRMK